jgi:hypothetical protein
MAIKRYAGDKLVGLSSDTKPTNVPDGANFYETNTLDQYILTGGTWVKLGSGTVTGVTGTAPIVSSGGATPALSISAATTSAAGSMSSADKTKLDGIASGAQVNVATNLSQGTRTTTTVLLDSSTGTSATLDIATTSLAGVMSSADKTKLDGIATGATAITNLDSLTDVVVASPTTGQVLKYNGTNWVNDTDATGSGGGEGITTGKAIAMAMIFG